MSNQENKQAMSITKTKSDFDLLFDATELIKAQRENIQVKDDIIELQGERIERQSTMLKYLRKFNSSRVEYIERTNEEIELHKDQKGLLELAADKYKGVAAWSTLIAVVCVVITIVVVIAHN